MGRWLWALVLATTSEAHYGPQCRLKSESGCSGSQRYFDPTASAVTFWPAAWTGGASDAPKAVVRRVRGGEQLAVAARDLEVDGSAGRAAAPPDDALAAELAGAHVVDKHGVVVAGVVDAACVVDCDGAGG